MAEMNPLLRLRNAFRDMGAGDAQADEATTVLDEIYLSRREFEDRIARLLAEQRNQFLFGVLVIVGLAVAIIVAVD